MFLFVMGTLSCSHLGKKVGSHLEAPRNGYAVSETPQALVWWLATAWEVSHCAVCCHRAMHLAVPDQGTQCQFQVLSPPAPPVALSQHLSSTYSLLVLPGSWSWLFWLCTHPCL